jgi:hypothetical protein
MDDGASILAAEAVTRDAVSGDDASVVVSVRFDFVGQTQQVLNAEPDGEP